MSNSDEPILAATPAQRSGDQTNPHAIILQTTQWMWNNTATASIQSTTLTPRTLSLTIGARASHISMEDVIGVERIDHDLVVHAYPVSTGCCSGTPPKREYMRTALTPVKGTTTVDAGHLATAWHGEFTKLLAEIWISHSIAADGMPAEITSRKRSIMILINPASGAGNAAANLETLVPMLKQSGVAYTVQKTTHANHAFEMLRDMDLNAADAPTDVVCVSGDGLVHEVVNGIMQRPDWHRACSQLRVGHIGGGSGNGLASAICAQATENIDLVSSMWIILKGFTRPMDIFSISQPRERVKFGFLSFNWGVVSDIDFESESMRYLGNARFTVAALKAFCCLKRYQGKLEFLVNEGEDALSSVIPPVKCAFKEDGCAPCDARAPYRTSEQGRRELQEYLASIGEADLEERKESDGDEKDSLSSINVVASSSSSSSGSLRWQSVDDEFTMVWAMNVSHGASDLHVAPGAHFSDGFLDVYYIRQISFFPVLSLFIDMETGKHTHHKDIHSIKAKGLRLTPHPKALKSDLNADGEKLPYKPAEVRVFRGVLNVLAR